MRPIIGRQYIAAPAIAFTMSMALLHGCAPNIKSDNTFKTNEIVTKTMPSAVAKSIVAGVTSNSWAESPKLSVLIEISNGGEMYSRGTSPYAPSVMPLRSQEPVTVRYADITVHDVYSPKKNSSFLVISGTSESTWGKRTGHCTIHISPLDEHDLVSAFVALGAKFSGKVVTDETVAFNPQFMCPLK